MNQHMMHIVIVDSILQSRSVAFTWSSSAKCHVYITYPIIPIGACSVFVSYRDERASLRGSLAVYSSCFGITVYFFLHVENDFNCCFDLCLIVPMCR